MQMLAKQVAPKHHLQHIAWSAANLAWVTAADFFGLGFWLFWLFWLQDTRPEPEPEGRRVWLFRWDGLRSLGITRVGLAIGVALLLVSWLQAAFSSAVGGLYLFSLGKPGHMSFQHQSRKFSLSASASALRRAVSAATSAEAPAARAAKVPFGGMMNQPARSL